MSHIEMLLLVRLCISRVCSWDVFGTFVELRIISYWPLALIHCYQLRLVSVARDQILNIDFRVMWLLLLPRKRNIFCAR